MNDWRLTRDMTFKFGVPRGSDSEEMFNTSVASRQPLGTSYVALVSYNPFSVDRSTIAPAPHRRTSANSGAHRTRDRPGAISRFPTRISRHGQNPNDGPQLRRNPRGEVYIRDLAERPSFQALHARGQDFRQLATDLDVQDKKRIYVKYGGNTDSYLAGVYNGHTVPVEQNQTNEEINRPGVYRHATTWEGATAIYRECVRSMGRNDIHMAPLHMTPRQESYIKPSSRKTHAVTIDGVMAAAAGIKFFLLENGVVTSRGTNGLIPPCCVSGLWPNTNMGRRCLSLDESLKSPPRVVPTTDMRAHGPLYAFKVIPVIRVRREHAWPIE